MNPVTEFPNPEESLEVDVHQVAGLLAEQSPAGAGFSLIDCREEDEFQLCRIAGATLIPLSTFGEIDPSTLGANAGPTVIYCHHGMRSAQAAQFLRQKGMTNAFSMAGGIDAWSQEIDPNVPRY